MKKDGLAELAKEIQTELKEEFVTDYDQAGAIGKRYRRQDEIGTPFCITFDYDSKEDNTVTLRFRDSMEQVRVPRSELASRIREEIKELGFNKYRSSSIATNISDKTVILMEEMSETNMVKSCDIVEVNPVLDVRNQTAAMAVKLIARLLGEKLF
jgi:hypothetical protein